MYSVVSFSHRRIGRYQWAEDRHGQQTVGSVAKDIIMENSGDVGNVQSADAHVRAPVNSILKGEEMTGEVETYAKIVKKRLKRGQVSFESERSCNDAPLTLKN